MSELSYVETLYEDEKCKGDIVGRLSYPSGTCVYGLFHFPHNVIFSGRKMHNCDENKVQVCSQSVTGCNTTAEGVCEYREMKFSSCKNQMISGKIFQELFLTFRMFFRWSIGTLRFVNCFHSIFIVIN